MESTEWTIWYNFRESSRKNTYIRDDHVLDNIINWSGFSTFQTIKINQYSLNFFYTLHFYQKFHIELSWMKLSKYASDNENNGHNKDATTDHEKM